MQRLKQHSVIPYLNGTIFNACQNIRTYLFTLSDLENNSQKPVCGSRFCFCEADWEKSKGYHCFRDCAQERTKFWDQHIQTQLCQLSPCPHPKSTLIEIHQFVQTLQQKGFSHLLDLHQLQPIIMLTPTDLLNHL